MTASPPPIPLVLLCGWLGAGKTTLLARLLASAALRGRRLAVLVNEFGKLPIDGALLPSGDYHLAEINRGSIFCICVKTDLIRDLERIGREIAPDLLLVEATGLAEVGDIAALLQSDFLRQRYRRALTVAVVDALNFPKLSRALPAIPAQVRAADLLLLNKTDLVDAASLDAVERDLRILNPSAPIRRTDHADADLPWEALLATPERPPTQGTAPHLCSGPPTETVACAFRHPAAVDRCRFYEALDRHRHRILRGKGIVDFGDARMFVEVVNGMVASRPADGLRFAPDQACAMDFVLRGNEGHGLLADLDRL
jgi:G3E family GTPase